MQLFIEPNGSLLMKCIQNAVIMQLFILLKIASLLLRAMDSLHFLTNTFLKLDSDYFFLDIYLNQNEGLSVLRRVPRTLTVHHFFKFCIFTSPFILPT